jgi:hypothetical protein
MNIKTNQSQQERNAMAQSIFERRGRTACLRRPPGPSWPKGPAYKGGTPR